MRKVALALIAGCALAACNPSAPSGGGSSADSASSGGGLFPDLSHAAYRAEANISGPNGQTMPIVMIRDSGKMRMEMSTGEGSSVIISNAQTGESVIITSAMGRTVAMRTSADQFTDPAKDWQAEVATTATRTGSCSVAGENGSEWSHQSGEHANTACVTSDGIILRATQDGRTTWETTRVTRGPQDAALFEVPAGVQVMDLNNLGAAMSQAMERAKGGGGN
ncbi:MAG: hypothetical protein JNJ63_05965 [Hyphomonadaceae bacterium]|nr:hypothetical protein [Hyphomonadaceae bacterium]